jgi:hypothetical protein
MLPGFRFLFTAIILSMSVLIFGLGAAALLRAAHGEFANLPARRTAPEPMFARPTDEEPPTLALLRIDTPADDVRVTGNVPATAVAETVLDTPAQAAPASDPAATEPEKLAALTPAEPAQAETAKGEPAPRATATDTPAVPAAIVEAPPAPANAPVPAAEVKVAAIAEAAQPAATAPLPPAAEPDIYSFENNPVASRIATLGGPAVLVDEKLAAEASKTEAKAAEAKPDRSAIRKRAAERAREKRRIAAARRARLAREAMLTLQQQQPNPFIQTPFTQDPLPRTTR